MLKFGLERKQIFGSVHGCTHGDHSKLKMSFSSMQAQEKMQVL